MKTQNLKSFEKLMASKKTVIVSAKEQTKVTGGAGACTSGYYGSATGTSGCTACTYPPTSINNPKWAL